MGRGKRRRDVSSLLFLIIDFFTGIPNRRAFGEETGILLVVASAGVRLLKNNCAAPRVTNCQGSGGQRFRCNA